jgi:hypothetical protein
MESTHISLSAVIDSEFEDLDVNFCLIRLPNLLLVRTGKHDAKGIRNVVFIPTIFLLLSLVDIFANIIIVRY